MTSFDTTPVELQAGGSALRQAAADGRADLSRVVADIEELLGGGWTGAAATRFASGFDRWRAAVADALTVLDELGEQVVLSGRAYTSSDEQGRLNLSTSGGAL